MRKLFLALPVLVLAGCQTPATVPSVSPAVTAVVGILPAQVQETAVKVCGFLPAAETVASLIAAFGGPSVPGVVNQIAAEICGAVTRRSGRSARVVRGVAIRGQFVR